MGGKINYYIKGGFMKKLITIAMSLIFVFVAASIACALTPTSDMTIFPKIESKAVDPNRIVTQAMIAQTETNQLNMINDIRMEYVSDRATISTFPRTYAAKAEALQRVLNLTMKLGFSFDPVSDKVKNQRYALYAEIGLYINSYLKDLENTVKAPLK